MDEAKTGAEGPLQEASLKRGHKTLADWGKAEDLHKVNKRSSWWVSVTHAGPGGSADYGPEPLSNSCVARSHATSNVKALQQLGKVSWQCERQTHTCRHYVKQAAKAGVFAPVSSGGHVTDRRINNARSPSVKATGGHAPNLGVPSHCASAITVGTSARPWALGITARVFQATGRGGPGMDRGCR